MFRSLWRNRQLIMQMARRQVLGRYRGSLMGLAWSFFHPLLMLTVYTFVFSVVFKARWGGIEGDSKAQFASVMFIGMILHGLLAEGINNAPGLILSNANYVKRVVFPLEVLPWVILGSALFHFAISLTILLAAQALFNGGLHATTVWLPIVVLPLLPVIMGCAWLLAATGVFIRDVAQITGIVTMVLMFMAPVFYPLTALPEQYRKWIYLNPLTFIIEQAREVIFFGRQPSFSGLVIYSVFGLLFAGAGFWWFQKARRGFADVL